MSKIDIDSIIDYFNIEVDAVEEVKTHVYKVKLPELPENTYIVDFDEAIMIACHPHIVGKLFDDLNLKSALKTLNVIRDLVDLENCRIVFEHVLRAEPGYKVRDALGTYRIRIHDIWIRPKYILESYRSHSPTRKIKIEYKNLPSNSDIVLIKPDTEATGRTSTVILKETFKAYRAVNSRILKMVLYGFISRNALKNIHSFIKTRNVKLYTFTIGNIASLAHNNYDMVLYGIDEGFYTLNNKIKNIGGTTSYTTLIKYINKHPPRLDQPGDWSSRQLTLFNGLTYERGNIIEHLTNSLRVLKRLRIVSKSQE